MKCHLCASELETSKQNFLSTVDCEAYHCVNKKCVDEFPVGIKGFYLIKNNIIVLYYFCYKNYNMQYSIIDNNSYFGIIYNDSFENKYKNIFVFDNAFLKIEDFNMIKEKFEEVLTSYVYQ